MRIIVKGSGFSVTPSLLQYVEDKINRLAKLLPEGSALPIARIELTRSTKHHRKGRVFYAEINLTVSGNILLRAEAMHFDIRSAFDSARREVRTELRKFKEKRATNFRRGARKVKRRVRNV